MYLNKAFLYGNLTRDPELRSLPSGVQVANFGVATNRVYKDKEGRKQEAVEFHNVVAFGRQAEVIGQYLRKGRPVLIEGRIQTRSWDDKATGQKKYRTEILVEGFQFGPSGGPAGQGGPAADPGQSTGKGAATPKGDIDTIEYPEEDIKPEDIPF